MSKPKYIEVKCAEVHNLKGIDVKISHGKITVITGLSGSGKSSLAFDTIYAEGQRKYIESLSAYARQFLGKLDKPKVEYIKGLAPAIAIQQKVITSNPRSTVGTTTEIYDYLKLLYSRIGKTISPISGNEVKRHTTTDVINYLNKKFKKNDKAVLLCPIIKSPNKSLTKQIEIVKKQGFRRLYSDGEIINIDEYKSNKKELFLVVDRILIDFEDEQNIPRYADSIQLSFTEGKGTCGVLNINDGSIQFFNNLFELDGMVFNKPTEHFFTFNNPYGACPKCEGFGHTLGIDHDLVFPDKSLSVYEGAIAPWKSNSLKKYLNKLIINADKFDFPIHRPINKLDESQYKLLWKGNSYFKGIDAFFAYIERKKYKLHYRVLLSRYRGRTLCDECNGSRLRKDASYVKINDLSIQDCVLSSIKDNLKFFKSIQFTEYEKKVSHRLISEIINRLTILDKIGLSYLTLNRQSSSLSGGESQRINLATSIGSSLVGSIYVLDEPSIGLHSKDTDKLISILKSLKDLGNTVIVVEHEEQIMHHADEIIDLGPKAGINGGNLVFQGSYKKLNQAKTSITAEYLTGKKMINIPNKRRNSLRSFFIKNADKFNLKNFDVEIPLNNLVCITGVSGSGKSTLVKEILYPEYKRYLNNKNSISTLKYLNGDLHLIDQIELIDQNPIGKSSRSNPVTYLKIYDDIRKLFSNTPLAKLRNYKPGFFSFNVVGGRCEMCEGEGVITVSMQFMADIHLPCESCNSKRFKEETLEVLYKEKSISDILEMSIDEAVTFFNQSDQRVDKKIAEKLEILASVGLGYLKLGQSSSTMSGGEAQRIKLASFLAKGKNQNDTLFIFDEPTTGLHFDDIKKLLFAFKSLIEYGHSIIVIEHNMDVIKCADYIIDLGPEGGTNGGNLLFAGKPEQFVKIKNNATSKYLKEKLS
mgnify:CR=1 FL=1